MVDAQQQADSRRILEAFCAAARRRALGEALARLERRGVDLVVVETALMKARALDFHHRESQRRKNRGIDSFERRARIRQDLIAATNAALRFYRDFYTRDIPESVIYLRCRELRDLLKKSYADVAIPALNDPVRASRLAALLPDPFYNDAAWSARRLRKSSRGARPKPHLTAARHELRKAGVPRALVPVLLRSIIP